MKLTNPFRTLTRFELTLWAVSAAVVTVSFLLGGERDFLTLTASLIGVTALIFVAKGYVLGQALTVVFSLVYALVSLKFRYYGEMITYLGMTAPIALMSVISWLKHPYSKGKPEVKAARMTAAKTAAMLVLAAAVTFAFYFILGYFGTPNLAVSTFSVATSFIASFLMLYRIPAYALAYAANDVVLIVLWVLASMEDTSYIPMVMCFLMFLCNDIYGFYSWIKMRRRQESRSRT
ncbi:MAG: nicotinamide mononucleotide transporter [Oscillospiraceae bacterium]|nr:nicotinamide mononucleotide transporter [Oscillospiraceae bacterium]